MRTNQTVVSVRDSRLGTIPLDKYSPEAEVSDTEEAN